MVTLSTREHSFYNQDFTKYTIASGAKLSLEYLIEKAMSADKPIIVEVALNGKNRASVVIAMGATPDTLWADYNAMLQLPTGTDLDKAAAQKYLSQHYITSTTKEFVQSKGDFVSFGHYSPKKNLFLDGINNAYLDQTIEFAQTLKFPIMVKAQYGDIIKHIAIGPNTTPQQIRDDFHSSKSPILSQAGRLVTTQGRSVEEAASRYVDHVKAKDPQQAPAKAPPTGENVSKPLSERIGAALKAIADIFRG